MEIYDSLTKKVIDNSKVLEYTNLTKDDMTPVFDALSLELDGLRGNYDFAPNKDQEKRIEEYLLIGGEIWGEI